MVKWTTSAFVDALLSGSVLARQASQAASGGPWITGASDDEAAQIDELFGVWQAKYPRNRVRSIYYDAKNQLKPTGNIPPESYAHIEAVLGWPEKAVSALASRVIFNGFTSPGQDRDPFDIEGVLVANRFSAMLPQTVVSMLKHSCALLVVQRGDLDRGERPVVITYRDAESAAAIWDSRRHDMKAALAITEYSNGLPSRAVVLLRDVTLEVSRNQRGRWRVSDRAANAIPGAVPASALTFDPQLTRPFGRSRISRPVMNIVDHGAMGIVRGEIGADFYSIPRLVLTKLAEDAITRGKWDAAIDRMLGFTKDEDGDGPEVKQLPQMTMQPLLDQYRMYASQMAGETGLPLSSLGIVQDNPPSAEALYAAEKDLIVTARSAARGLGATLADFGRMVVMIRDGLREPTSEMLSLSTNWLDAAFTSPVTSAVALRELSTVFPWMSDSEVALEYAGFSTADITRLLADKRRAEGGRMLDRILSAAPTEAPVDAIQG